MNTMSFDLTFLPQAAQMQLPITFLDGKTYIYNRFKPDNLMHLFHDDLLPIYATLQEIVQLPTRDIRLALLDNHDMDQRFSFLYGLLWENIITKSDMKDELIYCMEEAYVGVNRDTVWYDYGFLEHQKSLLSTKIVSVNVIQNFILYFMGKLKLNNIPCNDFENYNVLILRRHNRLVLNSNDIIQKLKEETGWPVKVLIEDDFSSENFSNVVKHIYCSSMLIGMHSGALILSLFLQPSASLLELYPYAVNPDYYTPFKTLAKINHLKYASWVNKLKENSVSHPHRPAELGGIAHLGVEDQTVIVTAETVKPHLCCRDPSWLFRIYQDTKVDTISFSATIKEIIARNASTDSVVQLQPGTVRNLHCNSVDGAYNLSWEKPWNMKYLEKKNYQYEIWIQTNDHTQSVITSNTYLVLKSSLHKIDCWVNVHRSKSKMQWTRCS
ncbi:Protein O-linked-mannose beta-1,4-N-acetylglucosaminyltransferase 2 [Chamberlinius hualienensis]